MPLSITDVQLKKNLLADQCGPLITFARYKDWLKPKVEMNKVGRIFWDLWFRVVNGNLYAQDVQTRACT